MSLAPIYFTFDDPPDKIRKNNYRKFFQRRLLMPSSIELEKNQYKNKLKNNCRDFKNTSLIQQNNSSQIKYPSFTFTGNPVCLGNECFKFFNDTNNSRNGSGNSGNGSGNSGNRSGNSGNRSGNSGNRSGNSGNRSGNSGNHSGNSGNHYGESGNVTGDHRNDSAGSGNRSVDSGNVTVGRRNGSLNVRNGSASLRNVTVDTNYCCTCIRNAIKTSKIAQNRQKLNLCFIFN